jgi:hypothetical protein
MDNLFENIDLQNLQNNPIIYGLLAVFLSIYGPRLHPKLPSPVRDLFNNNYFRFAVILLITYLSTRNLQAALVITISFCLILSFTNSQEVEAEVEEKFKENYSNFDTIREFYEDDDDDSEPFRNDALNTSEEAREDFKNPQTIIDGAQQKMTNIIPKRKGDENEEFDNYEHFKTTSESDKTTSESDKTSGSNNVPEVCKNNKNSKECLELCYKSDGNKNKWCENVHPNPENTLMLSKNCEKKKETKKKTKTENKEDFFNLPSLNNLDNLTKNIVDQVKKYKKYIV